MRSRPRAWRPRPASASQVAHLAGRGQHQPALRRRPLDPLAGAQARESLRRRAFSRFTARPARRWARCSRFICSRSTLKKTMPTSSTNTSADPAAGPAAACRARSAPRRLAARAAARPARAGVRAGAGLRAGQRGARRAPACGARGHQAASPTSIRRAARSLPDAERGLSATSPGRRRDRAAREQLGLGRRARSAQTGRSGGQMQPRARSARKRLTRRSSSEWNEIAASRPPSGSRSPGLGQRAVEIVQLVVDRDADGLEDALGGGAPAELAPHGGRQRGLDGLDELARGLDRRALAPRGRSRARSRARWDPRRRWRRPWPGGAPRIVFTSRWRRVRSWGPSACRAARRRSRRSRARACRSASRRRPRSKYTRSARKPSSSSSSSASA